jgi:hypothetical protein
MPYKRVVLHSELPIAELASRLGALIMPKRSFATRFKDSFSQPCHEAAFEGTMASDHFVVVPVINHRNTFLPTIHGHLSEDIIGTKIVITMHIHWSAAAFMLFWFGVIGYGLSVMLANGDYGFKLVLPIMMILFGVALVCGCFYPEVAKATKCVKQAIQ